MGSDTEAKRHTVASLASAKLKKAKARRKTPPPDDPNDPRPLITIRKGKLPDILNLADAALGEHDLRLFDHSGRLVRLTEPEEIDDVSQVRRRPGTILLHDVNVPNLCDRLARVARWQKWDARAQDYVVADVPREVAEGVLSRSGEWRNIRRLRGFVEAPTLRDDGQVLEQPGYDDNSELFFVGHLPKGYRKPGEDKKAAHEALHLIDSAFFDLPFVEREDRAAAVTAVLTALVRRVLPSAPLVGITAPTAGTGKSLLADAISIIATGRRAAVLGFGKDDIEGDKRLASALLAGDAVIAIDNVERPMYGDLICQALTQPTVRLRPLGSGHLVATSTNTFLMATANNLDVRGDLRRRVMLIRLDARIERPELRHFNKDFLADVTARRGELIWAGLTIIRAYLATRPAAEVNVPPFGSFEMWSKWCREPLVWLGYPDPLLASESLRESDPDLVIQRQFFNAWYEQFGTEAVTSAYIVKISELADAANLRAALDSVCQERVASRRLTSWLRRHRGRMLDGLRLSEQGFDQHSKSPLWKIEKF